MMEEKTFQETCDRPALGHLARELVALSRFGTEVINLTKDKQGMKPTGRYQVRFIDGGRFEWDLNEHLQAEQLLEKVNRLIFEETESYRSDLLGELQSLLTKQIDATVAKEFEQIADYYDAICKVPLAIQHQGNKYVMHLNPTWAMFFNGNPKDPNTKKTAIEWAESLQQILGLVRETTFKQLLDQIKDRIHMEQDTLKC